MIEIRWHSRGGQGAKTASLLLAEAMAAGGRYVQGFPEYGAEREGAPMLAFDRISDRPIRIHSGIEAPDIVVVLDPTLIGNVPVTAGLKEDGWVVVNTGRDPEEMRRKLGLSPAQRLAVVDGSGISQSELGRPIPNTPVMAALIRAAGLLERERFQELAGELFREKFKSKPEVVEGNLRSVERAWEEVKIA
jgi:pyruvate ferredoxin oxidoreductase gamma subunit